MRYIILCPVLLFAEALCGQVADDSRLDSIWRTLELDELVVTAQYAPTHYREAIHQVRVIKAVELRQQGQYSLAEALENQMNLRVTADPVLGSGLSIQGLGAEQIQVLIDGVPVIGRTDGSIDLGQILLHDIERIEIVEGAMSAQYGSNASGGVINVISRKSQLGDFSAESRNTVESVGIFNHSLGISGRSGSLSGRLNVSRIHYRFAPVDSFRLYETVEDGEGQFFTRRKIPWSPKLQHGVDGMLRYAPHDSLSVAYSYRHFDEQLFRYGERKRPVFKPYATDEIYRTRRGDHSLQMEWYPSAHWYVQSTSAFNLFSREKSVERLDFDEGVRTPQPTEQDTARFSGVLHRSSISSMWTGAFNMQLGLEWYGERGSGRRLLDSAGKSGVGRVAIDNYAAWLSIRYAPTKQLELVSNMRYGYNSGYRHPWVPSLHLRWQAHERLSLRAGYAYGFRAPSLKELYFNFIDVNHFITGNPELRAERSHNLRASADYFFMKNKDWSAWADGRIFYNYIADRIILAQVSGVRYSYSNIERFESHGANIGANLEYRDLFSLSTAFGLTGISSDLETAGSAAAGSRYSTEWRSSLSALIPGLGARLVITHNHFGRQFIFTETVDGLVQQSIPAYHMANVTLSRFFFKEHIHLSAGVKNILDVQQLAVSRDGGTHAGGDGRSLVDYGRSYFVGLDLRL